MRRRRVRRMGIEVERRIGNDIVSEEERKERERLRRDRKGWE